MAGKRVSTRKAKAAAPEAVAPASRKKAVIVFHGMGEQRPMDTLRSLVSSLIRFREREEPRKSTLVERILKNMARTAGTADSEHFWIVPDGKTGSHELARIRTRPRKINGESEQTDFFELYYADLLTGNTYRQFASWAGGLLFRRPDQVPRNQFWFWLVLWALLILVVAALGTEFMNAPARRFSEAWSTAENVRNAWTLLLSMLAGAVLAVFMAVRMSADGGARTDSAEMKRLLVNRNLPPAVNILFVLAVPVAVAVLAYLWFPWTFLWISPAARDAYDSGTGGVWPFLVMLWNWPALKLGLAALVYTLLQYFLIPYFGDVGRYVSTRPDAVATRNAIRERGLKLLEAVHDARRNGDKDGPPEYAEIVIIAHSLGSVIALDVVRLFWARRADGVAPHLETAAAQEAMVELDAYCRAHVDPVSGGPMASTGEDGAGFKRETFRALQGKTLAALLANPDCPYRITDFITAGSPLAHGDFLIARDLRRFIAAVHERVLPRCPPYQETIPDPGHRSFLFRRGAVWRPHHAAFFAFTRFAAFYDPRSAIVFGDFVGGPVSPNFGAGVEDIPVRMTRPGGNRLVTHTLYWDETVTARFADPANLPSPLQAIAGSDMAHLAGLTAMVWPDQPLTGKTG